MSIITMRRCPACGEALSGGLYCPHCGASTMATEPAQPAISMARSARREAGPIRRLLRGVGRRRDQEPEEELASSQSIASR
jgi:uncharacterized Zn finger protein (UPF0148 family)